MKRIIPRLLLLVLIATGCSTANDSSDDNRNTNPPKTNTAMQKLGGQTKQTYQLVSPGGELLPGSNRLVFAVLDKENAFVPGRNFELHYAPAQGDKVLGPVPVVFEDDGLGDRAFYRATVDFSKAGTWLLLITETGPAGQQGGGSQVEVKAKGSAPMVGEKAIPVSTPTLADHKGVADICTREPDDPMHDLSLDQALANGKPTVVTIATPAFCASRVCGPVVDQLLRVRDETPDGSVNFVHVEVYNDKPGGEFTEVMKQYKLKTEPWTFVIDKAGIIKARFEGPVSTGELKTAMGKLTLAQASAPSPTISIPPDAKPPGQRQPLAGWAAGAGIVIASAAGFYVYRVIRKGL